MLLQVAGMYPPPGAPCSRQRSTSARTASRSGLNNCSQADRLAAHGNAPLGAVGQQPVSKCRVVDLALEEPLRSIATHEVLKGPISGFSEACNYGTIPLTDTSKFLE
jgi:hypothetical protein